MRSSTLVRLSRAGGNPSSPDHKARLDNVANFGVGTLGGAHRDEPSQRPQEQTHPDALPGRVDSVVFDGLPAVASQRERPRQGLRAGRGLRAGQARRSSSTPAGSGAAFSASRPGRRACSSWRMRARRAGHPGRASTRTRGPVPRQQASPRRPRPRPAPRPKSNRPAGTRAGPSSANRNSSHGSASWACPTG